MLYLFAALLSAGIGVLPLALKRRVMAATIQGIVSAVVWYLLIYLNNPATVWPLFGVPGLFVTIGWIVAAMINPVAF